MNKKDYLFIALLMGIFALGFWLRFYNLSQFPPAINRDEAAIGYNAYSILRTGRDEWGKFLPLAFKSFGDYKMPLYIYATVIPVKIWGLTAWAVRFWSFLAGSLAVILIYFFARWFFRKLGWSRRTANNFSLLSALFLAINPWHLYFSRIGFEANLNLTFFLSGLTFFVYGLKRRWLLIFSSLSFALMLYTYSSSYIFLPLFLFIILILFSKNIFVKRDKWWLVAVVLLVILGSHATWSLWQVSGAKANITVFSDPSIIDSFNHQRTNLATYSQFLAKIWLNKPFFYFRIITHNYLATFSPKFLIISGGNHPWHMIPQMGNFYWLDLILMIIGLLALFKERKRLTLFLFAWILIAPIPSAITIDAPHATRLLQLIPPLVMLAAVGFGKLTNWLLVAKKKLAILLLFFLVYIFQIYRFGYLYFVSYPQNLSESLFPKIDEAIDLVNKERNDRIVIFSNPLDFPYIYVAFYSQFDPVLFQKKAIWKPANIANITAVEHVDGYYFWEGTPKVDQKAFYVLQGNSGPSAGFTLKNQVEESGKVYWSIYEN
ncbi:hypothetical protein A2160_02890 [Candidatus Beckwithbacteria bacterium RBG_13_42_9]|uniref:Uncharacterized protein n=1 Tax=Candidatus Beckwithbacteria bacterium RBG_13_42_9 TaxID=1797457 RepID=A0A1F5E7P9_9BACT|nr:MAG: hypothetical protein A2160_02890 [Candidatus Beckwithbacteria bacterium RBG_13_42_9]